MKEFVTLTDRATMTEARLKERCVWEQACHICGMPSAFDYRAVVSRNPKTGELVKEKGEDGKPKLEQVELASHKRLIRHSERINYLHTKAKQAAGEDECIPCPPVCEAATWPAENTERSLKILHSLARKRIKEQKMEKAKGQGEKPHVPLLECIRLEDDPREILLTSLRIAWEEAPDSEPVAFFVLESCGAEGSRSQQQQRWKRICTDPPSAESQQEPEYEYIMDNLQPNTSYHVRVRAFNGHGASGYNHCVFTTAPPKPPKPTAVAVSMNSITMEWSSEEFKKGEKMVAELRGLFESLEGFCPPGDDPIDKMVRRQTVIDALRMDHEELYDWLDMTEARRTPP